MMDRTGYRMCELKIDNMILERVEFAALMTWPSYCEPPNYSNQSSEINC